MNPFQYVDRTSAPTLAAFSLEHFRPLMMLRRSCQSNLVKYPQSASVCQRPRRRKKQKKSLKTRNHGHIETVINSDQKRCDHARAWTLKSQGEKSVKLLPSFGCSVEAKVSGLNPNTIHKVHICCVFWEEFVSCVTD